MNETAAKNKPAQDAVRKRSPRAPSSPLSDLLPRVLSIYDKEGRHEAPADVAAQDMGYANSKSSAAGQTLASMSYFGLLNRASEGKVAVAKEVEEYKFAPQENLKRDLLVRWLKTPQVYAELLEKYSTGLPSDATLKYDFIQKGFNAKVADGYVAAFRQSVEFARYYDDAGAGADASADALADEVPHIPSAPAGQVQNPVQRPPVNTPQGLPPIPPDFGSYDSIPVRLPGGRKAILVIPSPFYEADKARLKSQIDNIYAEDGEDDASA